MGLTMSGFLLNDWIMIPGGRGGLTEQNGLPPVALRCRSETASGLDLTEKIERDACGLARFDRFLDLPFYQFPDFPFLLLLRGLHGKSSPGTHGYQACRAHGESRNFGQAHSADALEAFAAILYGLEQLSLCAGELHAPLYTEGRCESETMRPWF